MTQQKKLKELLDSYDDDTPYDGITTTLLMHIALSLSIIADSINDKNKIEDTKNDGTKS